MDTMLNTASTRVADHVAANGRRLAPAFAGRNSAERYRQQVLDRHTQQAWQAPDPAAYARIRAEQARLLRLQAKAQLAYRLTLLGMALVLGVATIIRCFL